MQGMHVHVAAGLSLCMPQHLSIYVSLHMSLPRVAAAWHRHMPLQMPLPHVAATGLSSRGSLSR